MEIMTATDVDPEAVQQWIGDGLLLERGEEQQSDDAQPRMQSAATAGVEASPGAAPIAPRKGRRTNAEKAAERVAAEQAANQLAPPGLQLVQQPIPAAAPPGASFFPPGIAPPAVHPQGNGAAPPATVNPGVNVTLQSAAAPAPVQPIPAAMPKSEPLPPAENGVMRLEDFRAANMQLQKFRPGKMSILMKAGVWPSDKSAKDSWFTVEAVPPEFRMRLIDELEHVL